MLKTGRIRPVSFIVRDDSVRYSVFSRWGRVVKNFEPNSSLAVLNAHPDASGPNAIPAPMLFQCYYLLTGRVPSLGLTGPLRKVPCTCQIGWLLAKWRVGGTPRAIAKGVGSLENGTSDSHALRASGCATEIEIL